MGKTPRELNDEIHSQLNAVEKLQYQLTSHELQYAQRMAQSEQQAVDKVKVTVVSSSSDSNEGLCVLTYGRMCTVTTFIVRLRGRRLKRTGKGVLGARDTRGARPLAFLLRLKLPFPSLSNACYAGYALYCCDEVRTNLTDDVKKSTKYIRSSMQICSAFLYDNRRCRLQ